MTDFEYDLEGQKPVSGKSSAVKESTVLDRLREELRKEVSLPVIELKVPTRPNVKLQFSPNFTRESLRLWMKRSGQGGKAGLDDIKFACYVVGSTLEGIFVDDELVVNDDGVALNFASSEILAMVDSPRPIPEGIQRFFGDDGVLLATASTIIDHSGFGLEVRPEDADEDDEENPMMP